MNRIPHPIPYQGSKRNLAPLIRPYIPKIGGRFYEPFAGSAAMTLYAASHGLAQRFVLADTLPPLVELWRLIVEHPKKAAKQYCSVWEGQAKAGDEYFNFVRSRYNQDRDPIDLLYLVARCVKNAVRFNSAGNFTQSRDKRRLGMRPEKMAVSISGASQLLRGKIEFRTGDWRETLADAKSRDFVYMDPPYLGTSIGRDKRYHQQLTAESLIEGLSELNKRNIRFALSYDGMTGDKVYGPPLPDFLKMNRVLLHAGRSSQSTLSGKSEETVESLYLSGNLGSSKVEGVVRTKKPQQSSFAF